MGNGFWRVDTQEKRGEEKEWREGKCGRDYSQGKNKLKKIKKSWFNNLTSKIIMKSLI